MAALKGMATLDHLRLELCSLRPALCAMRHAPYLTSIFDVQRFDIHYSLIFQLKRRRNSPKAKGCIPCAAANPSSCATPDALASRTLQKKSN